VLTEIVTDSFWGETMTIAIKNGIRSYLTITIKHPHTFKAAHLFHIPVSGWGCIFIYNKPRKRLVQHWWL